MRNERQEESMATLKDELDLLASENDFLRSDKTQLSGEVDDLKLRVSKLESELADQLSRNQETVTELNETQERESLCRSDLVSLQEQFEKEKVQQNQKLSSLQEAIEELKVTQKRMLTLMYYRSKMSIWTLLWQLLSKSLQTKTRR